MKRERRFWEQFSETVKNHHREFKRKHCPMLAFSVKKHSGHPDPHPKNAESREHAAVITAYHAETDEVTLSHWGSTYQVSFTHLFLSNQALSATRSQEFYTRNPEYNGNNRDYTAKYLPSKQPTTIASIVPVKDTGFKAKLLIIEQPKVTPEWLAQRSAKLRRRCYF